MAINPTRGAPLTHYKQASPYATSHDVIEVIGGDFITPNRAKTVLGVNHNEDDSYIATLVDGVVGQVERFCRIDVIKKKRYAYYRSAHGRIVLPYGPHGEIHKVEKDGVDLTADDYDIYGIKRKTIEGLGYGVFYVEFDSGYDDNEWPPEIESACYQELSLQYKNRQDPDTPSMTSVNNMSVEARHLLSGIRRKAL